MYVLLSILAEVVIYYGETQIRSIDMKKRVLVILLSVMTILCCLTGSVSIEAAGEIQAPTGVSVKTNKKGNPLVRWKEVEKASKYRVYRKTENDSSWVQGLLSG